MTPEEALDSGEMVGVVIRLVRVLLTGVRWFYGVLLLVAGPIATVVGLVEFDPYLIIGGVEFVVIAWLIHPLGFQRWKRRRVDRNHLRFATPSQ